MENHLIKVSDLMSDTRKTKKGKKKNKNPRLIEADPEVDLDDIESNPNSVNERNEDIYDPARIDSIINSTNRTPWTYIVPTESSLRTIALKFDLNFSSYIYQNSRGAGNLHGVKKIWTYDVIPDGNCGYRCLSYALTGSENNHLKLRNNICDFIINRKILTLHEMFPEAIQEAETKRNIPLGEKNLNLQYWMKGYDLFAASIMLEINIVVLNVYHEWQLYNHSIQDSLSSMYMDLKIPTILLDNTSGDHFQVVKRVGLF